MNKKLLSGPLVLVVLLLAVVAMGIQLSTVAQHTLAPLLAVVAAATVLAAGLYLPLQRMWRRIVGGNVWVSFAVAIVVGASVLTSVFLNVNYYATDFSSLPVIEAEVIGKHQSERPVMRRVNRRTYVRSGERPVYEIDIKVDGYCLTLEENFERYRSVRNGSSVRVRCGRGALGLKVLRLM